MRTEEDIIDNMNRLLDSKSLTWTKRAEVIIDHQIKIIRLREPKCETKEVERYCRKNYPFGCREYWPYKAWLKVMRKKFPKPNQSNNNSNQLSLPLFD